MARKPKPEAVQENGGDPSCSEHGMMTSKTDKTWSCATKGCGVQWRRPKDEAA